MQRRRSSYNKKRKKYVIKRVSRLIIISIIIVISSIIMFKNKDEQLSLIDKSENIIIHKDKEDVNTTIAVSGNKNTNKQSTDKETNVENNILRYLPLEEDVNATDAKEVQGMLESWNYQREDGKKIAYLTFDDGPSEYVTNEILDVLEEKNVKATFFVLGSMIDENDYAKEALRRIVKEGHAVGNHGYCHRYDVLYPGGVVDADTFINDMKKSEGVMKSVLGNEFKTNVLRFPGGHSSWNTSTVDNILEEQGYSYIDWNTLNGDAEGSDMEPEQLVNRLRETMTDIYGNNDVIVVLMHDTDSKEGTAKSLGATIDYLRELGYEFKTLK